MHENRSGGSYVNVCLSFDVVLRSVQIHSTGQADGDMLNNTPSLRTLRAQEAAAVPDAVGDDRFIGRERERAEIAGALAAAQAGRGGLLLLAGDAGVGKTRLAQVALAESGLLAIAGAASQ